MAGGKKSLLHPLLTVGKLFCFRSFAGAVWGRPPEAS
jgi:hypothetical protein